MGQHRTWGTLLAALAWVGAASPALAERPHGHYPRPLYFRPSHLIVEESIEDIASFDAVVTSPKTDPAWLEALDAENPELTLLCFVSGVTTRDILDGYDPADSSGVLEHRTIHAVDNDWFLRDTSGNPITTWVGNWWSSWGLNLTPEAPVDSSGDRFGRWNGRTLARAMTTGVGGFIPSEAWDGIMLDQMFDSITWLEGRFGNGEIDADGDGVADDDEELNEAWRVETAEMLAELRSRIGDHIVVAMNGDTRMLDDVDGASFEECLHHRSWWVDMYGYGDGHGGYLSSIDRCRPGPGRFGVFYARYFVGITDIPFDQFARLAAGSSALGDGYYVLEKWDAGAYEAVLHSTAYNIDWGTPLGEMERIPAGADTLYGRAFTRAYVEVNPYPHPLLGVPRRDIRVTWVGSPAPPSIDAGETDAELHLQGLPEADAGAVLAIEIRYSDEPLTDENFESGELVHPDSPVPGDGGASSTTSPSAPFDAVIEELEPASWYHVASRFHYRGGLRSPVSDDLAFRTEPVTPEWTPPDGAGPDGDERWDASWQSVGPNGDVHDVHVDASAIYIAGDFDHVGGRHTGGVARLEEGAWRTLSEPLEASAFGLAPHEGGMAVGGSFDGVGGRSPGVAAWSGTWSVLGDGLAGDVHGLEVVGGRLVASGTFFTDNATRPGFARWDGEGWERIPRVEDARIRSVGKFGGWRDRLVAHVALRVRDRADEDVAMTEHVARWMGSEWQALGGPVLGSVHAYVEADDGSLIVGGDFFAIGGVAANHVARWTGTEWEPLGTGLNGVVHALDVVNGLVVAGGAFTSAGDEPAPHLARWDGVRWTPVGTGVDGPVFTIHAFESGLVIGGNFDHAGPLPAPNIANWGVEIDGATPTDDDDAPSTSPVTPDELALRTLSANPSERMRIAVVLPIDAEVSLDVFDVSGRRVRRLLEGGHPAGVFEITWSGETEFGGVAATGVYFIRLRANDDTRQVTARLVR
jgi:hypothetical protein